MEEWLVNLSHHSVDHTLSQIKLMLNFNWVLRLKSGSIVNIDAASSYQDTYILKIDGRSIAAEDRVRNSVCKYTCVQKLAFVLQISVSHRFPIKISVWHVPVTAWSVYYVTTFVPLEFTIHRTANVFMCANLFGLPQWF